MTETVITPDQELINLGIITPEGAINWDRWLAAVPPVMRADFYMGIISAIYHSGNTVPEPYYAMLGKAYATDGDAMDMWEEERGMADRAPFDIMNLHDRLRNSDYPASSDILGYSVQKYDSPGNEIVFDLALFGGIYGGLSVALAGAGTATASSVTTGLLTRSAGPVAGGIARTAWKPFSIALSILGKGGRGTQIAALGSAALSSGGYLYSYFSGVDDAAIREQLEAAYQEAERAATIVNGVTPMTDTQQFYTKEQAQVEGLIPLDGQVDFQYGTGRWPGATAEEELAGLNEDDPYIGIFDPSYTTEVEQVDQDGNVLRTYEQGARYRYSQIEDTLGNMTPGMLVEFEEKALNAGLIDENSRTYSSGIISDDHLAAMNIVMGNANRSGTDWQVMLTRMERIAAEKPDKPWALANPFIRRAYLTPDPAELEEAARAGIRQKLGRDINDWEMALLSDRRKALHRAEYSSIERARFAEWQSQGRAHDEEREIGPPPRDVQGVNVDAQFEQFINEKFAKEINRAETTNTVANKTGSLMAGLNRAAGLIGS